MRTGQPIFDFQHIIEASEGQQVTLSINAAPVRGEDGALRAVVASMRDVTERNRAELRARQAQKMEAIGTLAGGIAHDFNNILTAIIGHAELLEISGTISGEAAEDLDEIRRSAERARNLTRQLLAFSRRQMLQPETLNLADTITEMRRMLTRIIREDIDQTLDMADNLWPVHADATQIQQIVLNLVVNARDAIASVGRIELLTRNVPRNDVLRRKYPSLNGR